VVVEAAYAVCQSLARRHYENFPVVSWMLPHEMRPHVAVVYAFARTADDFADEGARSDAERLALIDDWRERLHASAAGRVSPGAGETADAVFTALAETFRRRGLERQPFDDLLDAFAQDVAVKRYPTWDAVLDYCRRSANPVGRLVLGIAGCVDAQAQARSDDLCTALQLTNFWQDLERDWARGRLYVPQETIDACGAREDALRDRHLTPAWREAMRVVGRRTRALFEAGRPVADAVSGLRWQLRATWLGGVRVLDRLERADFDVFHARPSLGWRDGVVIGGRALMWRSAAAG
jgi:squalene synthase HpnC